MIILVGTLGLIAGLLIGMVIGYKGLIYLLGKDGYEVMRFPNKKPGGRMYGIFYNK